MTSHNVSIANKSSGHLRATQVKRYQFIDGQREAFPVVRLCQVMAVSPSGYYSWRKRPASARKMADQALLKQIRQVHQASHEIYGSPRVYGELKEQGVSCSRKRVARLMGEYGWRGRQTKRYKQTTRANAEHLVEPNPLDGDFTAEQPNRKWTVDITYIPTLEGWLYLAVVLDLFSRPVVGWAMDARLASDLVLSALGMAIRQRQPAEGLLHHTDRGSQDTGQPYRRLLAAAQIRLSMSGRGNCHDNAVTESFFSSLKGEWADHRRYASRADARTDLFFYIEAFYNVSITRLS